MFRRHFQILRGYPPAQLFQYLAYRIHLWRVKTFPASSASHDISALNIPEWNEAVPHPVQRNGNSFTFLNLEKKFEGPVDWGFQDYGKLWQIQLHNFEYLLQPGMSFDEGRKLFLDFGKYIRAHPSAFHPYTASLRIIHALKFLSIHRQSDKDILRLIAIDAAKLNQTVEYHLCNNHLLENGFALLFAGVYLQNREYLKKAETILAEGLRKQILSDGAHFECSPMYHRLMLNRVLDAIHLLKSQHIQSSLLPGLRQTASRMTGWLQQMRFENGDIPDVNDSTNDLGPAFNHLFSYAHHLEIVPELLPLGESGYRKIQTSNYECLIDIGGFGPPENAGHAHSDSLHFILYVNGTPFIIDTGTGTYDDNDLRHFQRSTQAHNTVSVDDQSQSELWGSFRVGKRAQILGVREGKDYLEATVRYAGSQVLHTRRFDFSANRLVIHDKVSGANLELQKTFLYVEKYSHLAIADSKVNSKFAEITFTGNEYLQEEDAGCSKGFNKREECKRIIIQFRHTLITTFTFHTN